MAKATADRFAAEHQRHGDPAAPQTHARRLDWRRRMSNTVAYALLVYTSLQIFVTAQVLSDRNASMLPMFALVVMVVGFIPLLRHFERHWEALSAAEAADPALGRRFRHDALAIWLMAMGLPFAITAVFRCIVMATR